MKDTTWFYRNRYDLLFYFVTVDLVLFFIFLLVNHKFLETRPLLETFAWTLLLLVMGGFYLLCRGWLVPKMEEQKWEEWKRKSFLERSSKKRGELRWSKLKS